MKYITRNLFLVDILGTSMFGVTSENIHMPVNFSKKKVLTHGNDEIQTKQKSKVFQTSSKTINQIHII